MKKTAFLACLLLPTLSMNAFADTLDDERNKNLHLSRAQQSDEVFYKRSSMAAGKTAEYKVRLQAGQQYGLYADCDDKQCSDLDMQWVYKGKILDQDMGGDTYPLLTVTPQETGDYTIRTLMSECAQSRCDYHVQVVKEEPTRTAAQAADSAGTFTDSTLPAPEFLTNERAANLKGHPELFYEKGALASGKTADYRVPLKAQQNYTVYVDCAPIACKNVDMALLVDGKVVDKDELDDTYPLLHVTPKRDATYTVRVKMVECKEGNDTCDYHVQVVGRNSDD